MAKIKRIVIAAAALLALAGCIAQITLGIATGTASPCSPAGICAVQQWR